MNDKERYLEEQISLKTQFWMRTMLILGIVLFPFIGIADYFITPRNFPLFFKYRLAITAILAIFFFLNRLKRKKSYQYALIYIVIVLSAITIEMMILSFGGHASSYYAGLNLLIVASLGLIPFSTALAISSGLSIYAIYLIPILLFDTISDPATFLANNIFMIATYMICMTWRIITQKTMLNELSLQYDIAQSREKLVQYSAHLEINSLQLKGMVEDRTKELRTSEQWHRAVFENASDGIVILDRNGIIVNLNEKACAMHGFSRDSLIGTHVNLLEDSGNKDGMVERMRRILDGESLVYEAVHNKKDGALIYLEISSKTIRIADQLFIQSFYRDITEKKKIQQHLFQSQKMESIGVLAGGIAHDLNNILTAILGHTELIRRTDTLDDQGTRSLNVVEDASRRAGQMIAKLLGFARKSNYQIVPVNMNDVICDTIKLIEQIIDKQITIALELDNNLPLVQGDISHLEQILMNLIVNARDAMPHGGRITIKDTTREVKKGDADMPVFVPPGRYIQLSVSDNGIGIPEHLLGTIFEPFFTTKERGKGTGLGLSMVYGAVKEHKGYITVRSKLGEGTTFLIYFPVYQPAASQEKLKPAYPAIGGTESIFVVDDDEHILNSMQENLKSHGYQVIACQDPEAALDIFRRLPQDIDLLITDIVMPRLNGKELIRQVKTNKPDVKVLAVSGYSKYVADKDDITTIDGFLHKPFESRQLLAAVRKILDTKTPDFITI